MSRSIGDYVAETVGVIALPDVQFHKRNSMIDKAIIICSDGLSDFLSEDDMYYIIKPFYGVADTEEASCQLLNEATKRWESRKGSIDDISAIVIFFH